MDSHFKFAPYCFRCDNYIIHKDYKGFAVHRQEKMYCTTISHKEAEHLNKLDAEFARSLTRKERFELMIQRDYWGEQSWTPVIPFILAYNTDKSPLHIKAIKFVSGTVANR